MEKFSKFLESTHSDLKGFVKEIIDKPTDLTNWLVLADYFQDKSDSFADIIRKGIDAAQAKTSRTNYGWISRDNKLEDSPELEDYHNFIKKLPKDKSGFKYLLNKDTWVEPVDHQFGFRENVKKGRLITVQVEPSGLMISRPTYRRDDPWAHTDIDQLKIDEAGLKALILLLLEQAVDSRRIIHPFRGEIYGRDQRGFVYWGHKYRLNKNPEEHANYEQSRIDHICYRLMDDLQVFAHGLATRNGAFPNQWTDVSGLRIADYIRDHFNPQLIKLLSLTNGKISGLRKDRTQSLRYWLTNLGSEIGFTEARRGLVQSFFDNLDKLAELGK